MGGDKKLDTDGAGTAPPLVKLLRQLSSDRAGGRITASQSTAIKQQLLAGNTLTAAAAASVTVSTTSASSSSAVAVAPTDAAAIPTGDDSSTIGPPLVPLLRQLSSCAKDGLITPQQKTSIKALLFSGSTDAIADAKQQLSTISSTTAASTAAAAAAPPLMFSSAPSTATSSAVLTAAAYIPSFRASPLTLSPAERAPDVVWREVQTWIEPVTSRINMWLVCRRWAVVLPPSHSAVFWRRQLTKKMPVFGQSLFDRFAGPYFYRAFALNQALERYQNRSKTHQLLPSRKVAEARTTPAQVFVEAEAMMAAAMILPPGGPMLSDGPSSSSSVSAKPRPSKSDKKVVSKNYQSDPFLPAIPNTFIPLNIDWNAVMMCTESSSSSSASSAATATTSTTASTIDVKTPAPSRTPAKPSSQAPPQPSFVFSAGTLKDIKVWRYEPYSQRMWLCLTGFVGTQIWTIDDSTTTTPAGRGSRKSAGGRLVRCLEGHISMCVSFITGLIVTQPIATYDEFYANLTDPHRAVLCVWKFDLDYTDAPPLTTVALPLYKPILCTQIVTLPADAATLSRGRPTSLDVMRRDAAERAVLCVGMSTGELAVFDLKSGITGNACGTLRHWMFGGGLMGGNDEKAAPPTQASALLREVVEEEMKQTLQQFLQADATVQARHKAVRAQQVARQKQERRLREEVRDRCRRELAWMMAFHSYQNPRPGGGGGGGDKAHYPQASLFGLDVTVTASKQSNKKRGGHHRAAEVAGIQPQGRKAPSVNRLNAKITVVPLQSKANRLVNDRNKFFGIAPTEPAGPPPVPLTVELADSSHGSHDSEITDVSIADQKASFPNNTTAAAASASKLAVDVKDKDENEGESTSRTALQTFDSAMAAQFRLTERRTTLNPMIIARAQTSDKRWSTPSQSKCYLFQFGGGNGINGNGGMHGFDPLQLPPALPVIGRDSGVSSTGGGSTAAVSAAIISDNVLPNVSTHRAFALRCEWNVVYGSTSTRNMSPTEFMLIDIGSGKASKSFQPSSDETVAMSAVLWVRPSYANSGAGSDTNDFWRSMNDEVKAKERILKEKEKEEKAAIERAKNGGRMSKKTRKLLGGINAAVNWKQTLRAREWDDLEARRKKAAQIDEKKSASQPPIGIPGGLSLSTAPPEPQYVCVLTMHADGELYVTLLSGKCICIRRYWQSYGVHADVADRIKQWHEFQPPRYYGLHADNKAMNRQLYGGSFSAESIDPIGRNYLKLDSSGASGIVLASLLAQSYGHPGLEFYDLNRPVAASLDPPPPNAAVKASDSANTTRIGKIDNYNDLRRLVFDSTAVINLDRGGGVAAAPLGTNGMRDLTSLKSHLLRQNDRFGFITPLSTYGNGAIAVLTTLSQSGAPTLSAPQIQSPASFPSAQMPVSASLNRFVMDHTRIQFAFGQPANDVLNEPLVGIRVFKLRGARSPGGGVVGPHRRRASASNPIDKSLLRIGSYIQLKSDVKPESNVYGLSCGRVIGYEGNCVLLQVPDFLTSVPRLVTRWIWLPAWLYPCWTVVENVKNPYLVGSEVSVRDVYRDVWYTDIVGFVFGPFIALRGEYRHTNRHLFHRIDSPDIRQIYKL